MWFVIIDWKCATFVCVFTSCEYNLRFTTRSLYDNPSYTLSSFYILLTSAIMYAAQLRTTLPCECVAFNVQLQLRRAAAAVPVSDAVTLPVVFSPACGCVQPEHVTPGINAGCCCNVLHGCWLKRSHWTWFASLLDHHLITRRIRFSGCVSISSRAARYSSILHWWHYIQHLFALLRVHWRCSRWQWRTNCCLHFTHAVWKRATPPFILRFPFFGRRMFSLFWMRARRPSCQ